MMRALKGLSIATVAVGLLSASIVGGRAEDTSHEAHHPAGAATEEPQAAKPDATTKPDATADAKKMGGMMDGDHMSQMMKMMQEMHGKMMGGGMAMMPKGDAGPSSMALNGIMMKMQQDMAMTYTGNTDIDFVKGMIPHHQSAVDMARTVLAFGKDPDVKKMAEGVIKAQESEIAWMKEWLKKQGQ
ncbi:CopM family metallochaperone [Hyphomicrobium sp. 2TAF46]|uniref:CopM family metallochaperone n=1 Tax=Hyphomicrobium sp. 2TAF46 TaxID=3233019 RepID=UPI003F91E664